MSIVNVTSIQSPADVLEDLLRDHRDEYHDDCSLFDGDPEIYAVKYGLSPILMGRDREEQGE